MFIELPSVLGSGKAAPPTDEGRTAVARGGSLLQEDKHEGSGHGHGASRDIDLEAAR